MLQCLQKQNNHHPQWQMLLPWMPPQTAGRSWPPPHSQHAPKLGKSLPYAVARPSACRRVMFFRETVTQIISGQDRKSNCQ